EPSRRLFGKEAIASVAIVVIVGKIITDKTIVPGNKLKPVEGYSNLSLIKGTKIVSPINPYTPDGIPTSSTFTGRNIRFPQAGAIPLMKLAQLRPRGASSIAVKKLTASDP